MLKLLPGCFWQNILVILTFYWRCQSLLNPFQRKLGDSPNILLKQKERLKLRIWEKAWKNETSQDAICIYNCLFSVRPSFIKYSRIPVICVFKIISDSIFAYLDFEISERRSVDSYIYLRCTHTLIRLFGIVLASSLVSLTFSTTSGLSLVLWLNTMIQSHTHQIECLQIMSLAAPHRLAVPTFRGASDWGGQRDNLHCRRH